MYLCVVVASNRMFAKVKSSLEKLSSSFSSSDIKKIYLYYLICGGIVRSPEIRKKYKYAWIICFVIPDIMILSTTIVYFLTLDSPLSIETFCNLNKFQMPACLTLFVQIGCCLYFERTRRFMKFADEIAELPTQKVPTYSTFMNNSVKKKFFQIFFVFTFSMCLAQFFSPILFQQSDLLLVSIFWRV